MNVKIGMKAAQFPEKEYINGICISMYNTFFILEIYQEVPAVTEGGAGQAGRGGQGQGDCP